MRAVAVSLVVLYHAGLPGLHGGFVGVDVFFVISGFLITGNIDRLLGANRFTLLGFYANRARRLLPAAFATIAITCLVGYFVLPPERFDGIGHDGIASALYIVNWRLSLQSVDYLAQGQAASPFQHFWSLAVEEQYYLIWPLLLLLAYAVSRARGRRMALAIAATLAFVPSFVYSVIYTSSHSAQAYFVTTTRMWELAVGGIAALAAPAFRRMPSQVAALIGWLGLAGILAAAFVYSGATYFPGYAAALPVLGAAAVIVCGPAAGAFGPVAVLGRAPAVMLGNLSYSLYLWHWPIIVFVTAQFTGGLPLWAGLVAAAGSLVPAYLSYRFIETPALRSPMFASTGAGLRLGALTTVSSVLAAMLLIIFIPPQNVSAVLVSADGTAVDVNGHTVKVGAEVLRAHPLNDPAGAPKNHFASITPSPLTASTQDQPADGRCSIALTVAADVPCVFGSVKSKTQVDLIGDSHAMQWQPALAAAGDQRGWRVVVHAHAGCPFMATLLAYQGNGKPFTPCRAWNVAVTKSIIAEHPSLVVTSEVGTVPTALSNGKPLSGKANDQAIVQGYIRAWRALTSAGIPVVVLAETPEPGIDTPSCVSAHLDQLSACARPRSQTIDLHTPQREAAHEFPAVHFVDMNDVVCPTAMCAPVIGGVLVYRDSNHLGATYVATTTRFFGARMAPFVRRGK